MRSRCIYWLIDPRDRDTTYGPFFNEIDQTRKAKELLNQGWPTIDWLDIYRDGREITTGTMEAEYVDEQLALYEEVAVTPISNDEPRYHDQVGRWDR